MRKEKTDSFECDCAKDMNVLKTLTQGKNIFKPSFNWTDFENHNYDSKTYLDKDYLNEPRDDDNLCHEEAKYVFYECIHPPSPDYNQYDGENGYWLGPDESKPLGGFRYSKDPKDDSNKLHRYFFCWPSYEDENHMIIRVCEKHYKEPTFLRPEVQWRIDVEKDKRLKPLNERKYDHQGLDREMER